MSRDHGVPWGGPTGLTSMTWLDVPIQSVYIRDLIAMQDSVNIAALIQPGAHRVSLDPFVHVVAYDGQFYLEDGHTRALAAMIEGRIYIRARIFRIS